MEISVIISTYNSIEWLEKVLWGYENQLFKDFEMVIADDGSGPETKLLIDSMAKKVFYPIQHIWQEDDGFQKSRILNKAIVACKTDYIVMSDGDCIPRKDFLQVHHENKEAGFFISGGYFKLPMTISKAISKENILSGACFQKTWLKERGLKKSFKNNKLTARKAKATFLNKITTTNSTWNGHNASGWKKDILKVNGLDERMQYGGQDRELGERLMNLGIKGKQFRYSAICLHLDHKRGYKTPESIQKNLDIRSNVKKNKLSYTPFGIVK
ncbi:glycosyltransferase family 2 protein [Lutimonas sp.]|uniref:glycosyltransferase family 2 protein n=1 Tax=Lutimonas sp. TaxID=1872403 RepID=UPI003D9B4244